MLSGKHVRWLRCKSRFVAICRHAWYLNSMASLGFSRLPDYYDQKRQTCIPQLLNRRQFLTAAAQAVA